MIRKENIGVSLNHLINDLFGELGAFETSGESFYLRNSFSKKQKKNLQPLLADVLSSANHTQAFCWKFLSHPPAKWGGGGVGGYTGFSLSFRL